LSIFGEQKKSRRATLLRMNTQLITYTNPKSLPDGAKLFPVAAAKGESSQHRKDSEPKPLFTIEEIRLRVETVTPLLREIRDYRPTPADHWGINE
jgi:hypothetical protein